MGDLYRNGVTQSDLYDLISTINTNLIALYTQLVADTTVNTATYLSANSPGTLSAKINAKGMDQGAIVAWLNNVIVGWNATMALLDADTGVTATTYVATYGITDAINTGTVWTANGISDNGMLQGDLVLWLNTIVTNLNAVNAVLDADSLQLSDYAANFNVTDTVRTKSTID